MQTIVNFITQKLKKMSEFKVQTTKNYSQFTFLKGNRSLNKLHELKLRKSIDTNYLFTIIIVNEKFEIIDGQHRFMAIKHLQLPIYYVVIKNYGLKEVQLFNQNNHKWKIDDYTDGYCDLGFADYIIFRDFKNKYKFSDYTCVLFLSQEDADNTRDRVKTNSVVEKFKLGLFKVNNIEKAISYAEMFIAIKEFYKGYQKTTFIKAMWCMIHNKNFVFSEFINKLKLMPTALKPCANSTIYKELIEDIYNRYRRDKVNLRF